MSTCGMSSCKVVGNVAGAGGGIHLGVRAAASIMGGLIAANTAIRQGGGLRCLECAFLRMVSLLKHNRAREV
jgi:hypothetical protein